MDGRYVVFVPGHFGWLEPHLILRVGKDWRFLNSSEVYPDEVVAWLGPMPVMSREAFERGLAPPKIECSECCGNGQTIGKNSGEDIICPVCKGLGSIVAEFDL